MIDRSYFTYCLGEVERMRAEGCGIADAAEQEHYKAPTPRSSIPIRGEANSKETSLNYSQRMRPQPNACTVRHLL